MTWEPKSPLEFIALFVAMWCAICFLLGALGGWMALAEHFRLTGTFVGRKWYMCSAQFRVFVSYSGVLTMGANDQGLYLAVLLPFRLGHPPLLIPWRFVRKAPRGLFNVFSTPLELGDSSRVRMTISSRIVRRFEEVLGHELQPAV